MRDRARKQHATSYPFPLAALSPLMMHPPQKRIARGHAAGATERLAEARTEIADLNAVHAAALRRNEELELALRETSAALRSLQLTNDERAF